MGVQDSALDSLAEARRVVLPQIGQVASHSGLNSLESLSRDSPTWQVKEMRRQLSNPHVPVLGRASIDISSTCQHFSKELCASGRFVEQCCMQVVCAM